ncbi:MAG: branched-chain amino acid ABC transporter permease [Thermodesulfobacteriota bacterium]|nr:branched-chain amino acid ABC transporter permease [Thermodesulfobacteriota bacterium]
MEYFLQLLITGIMVGGVYSLAATGFVIVYRTSKVINFAYGEFVMLGAFVTYLGLQQMGIPIWLTLPMVIIAMVILSAVIERVVLRPLVGRSTTINTIMVTIGLAMLLTGITRIIWGSQQFVLPSIVPLAPIKVGLISIPPVYILSMCILLVVLAGLAVFFTKSVTGIAMRAVSNDEMGAYSIGINIPKMLILAWSIAGVIAGFAGIIQANLSVLSIELRGILILLFPVVVLGGLESIKGAVIAGFIIGVIEALSAGYIDPLFTSLPLSQIIPIMVLLILILIYPYGFYGIKEIERL